MTLGMLMEKLNSVWIGNEELLKNVKVKMGCHGCVFEMADTMPDYEHMSLIFADSEFIREIWPRIKREFDKNHPGLLEKEKTDETR